MTDLYTLSDDEVLANDFENSVEEETTKTTSTELEETTVEETTTTTDDNSEVNSKENIDKESQAEEPEELTVPDYEAFYKTMTKPFKANGREIQVENADDAVRLMQMGANYSKKMEQLKPKQALLKVLEEHNLDNKEQLGYLVDLVNKKPEAIAKLIKESEIDLYDFDTEQANEYKPTLDLQEPTLFENVLSDVLLTNPEMSTVMEDITSWDNFSKQAIYGEPKIITAIAEQKANGMYDKIINYIDNQRMFGRMLDIPYLQAYSEVEAMLLAQETKTNTNTFTAPRPNKPNVDNNTQKKQASLPNNSTTVHEQPFNPLTVSDDELMKLLI